jgi:hypothetical protein
VSYAEWARRGFAELTVVATLCAGVILALALIAPAASRRRRILVLELIVLGETQVLLHSAFRRVLLYEGAYGFTTTRVYAQAYMLVVAASLLLLAYELLREPSARRLLGRAGALAVLSMAGVSIWNHEAWIVRQNVARYAETGKLDTRYLACDLSARAVPEVLSAADRVGGAARDLTRTAMCDRFESRLDDAWYEWIVGRSRARSAIAAAGIVGPGRDASRRRVLGDGIESEVLEVLDVHTALTLEHIEHIEHLCCEVASPAAGEATSPSSLPCPMSRIPPKPSRAGTRYTRSFRSIARRFARCRLIC